MLYELPVNQTGLLSLATYVNDVTNGAFGILTLMMVWVIVFMYLHNETTSYSTKTEFLVACFITLMLCIMFYISGLVHSFVLFICIILSVVALWYNKGNKDF